MKSLREWATPLTIGTFAVMGVTGVLIFFHSATELNKNVHEWCGLVMVAAVLVHAVVNWPSLKRYFITSNLARGIVGVCVLILVGSFATLSGPKGGGSPVIRAFNAVVHAPIANVAALQGKTSEELIADLKAVDIIVSDPQQSIDAATGGDRERQKDAVKALFPSMK